MTIKELGPNFDKEWRNDLNNNFKEISGMQGSVNDAVNKAKTAEQVANEAKIKSDTANDTSNSVQNQLDTIVINGDSSVEAAQARVDEKGGLHSTLKERIDSDSFRINALSQNFLNGEYIEAKGFEYNGTNFTSLIPGEFKSQRAKGLLDYSKNVGMESLAIVCTWFTETATSNTIMRTSKTIPDDDVISLIQEAKAKGLKVMLKPHVDVLDGTWRGMIVPSNPSAWFNSYSAFIENYAKIAEEYGVELFCVGTEFKKITGSIYRLYWQQVIVNIRSKYSGKLTYAATTMLTDDYEEYKIVSFWDLIDFAGLDVYFKLTDKEDPTVFDATRSWSKNLENIDLIRTLKEWQLTHGKPVIFAEIGCTNYKGCLKDPGKYNWDPLIISNEEQAMFVESMMRVWSSQSKWLKGFFWWRITINENDSYTFEKRPSGAVFKKWLYFLREV